MNNLSKDYTKTEFSTHYCDVTGDYILPDSFKDVKSVLSSNARISELSKYFGPSDAQISGNIVYNIVFTVAGEDNKDEICSVTFSEAFKQSCKYKYESNIGAGTLTSLSDINCRMANPRKFSIKSSLKTLMFEDVKCDVYPEILSEATQDANLQYKSKTVKIIGCYSALLNEHSFSDNIELDMKLPEIDKIISCDSTLNIHDERNSDSKNSPFKLGGTFTLNIIYLDANGEYQLINKDIPFNVSLIQDEILMLTQGNDEILGITPSVNITALTANPAKNQYDENKIIEFDADYDIDLIVFITREAEYITDVYSTKYETEIKTENKSYLTNCTHLCNNFTNSDTISKASFNLNNETALYPFGQKTHGIQVTKTESSAGLFGKLNTSVIISENDGSYRRKEITSDFNYRASVPENSVIVGNCFSTNNKLRYDGENIHTDSEIYIDYILCDKTEENICTYVMIKGNLLQEDSKVFSIYYPNESDSLWDCAKKKRVTIDSLKASNPDIAPFTRTPLIIE